MNKETIVNDASRMTDDQIVTAYIALSQQLYNQYHDRRGLEWRIHLALWTFLALIAYLCVTENKHLGNVAYGIFLAIPIHIVWIIKIVRGETLEQNLSIQYRSEIERILRFRELSKTQNYSEIFKDEEQSQMPKWMERFKSYYWWFGVQVATTAFICFGVWSLVR